MSTSTTKSGRAAAASLWDVQLAGGETKMTVDELDSAFQQSSIDEHTLVRKAGSARWKTLGEAAGLDASTGKLPPSSSKELGDEKDGVTTLTAPGQGSWVARFRPRSRKRMLIGFAAAAALVVGVFAVKRVTSSHAPAVAAAAPASVSPPAAPPQPAPPPAVAAATPAATPVPAASPASPAPVAAAPAAHAPSSPHAVAAGSHRAGHAGHGPPGKGAKPRRAEVKKARAQPHKPAKAAASVSAYGRLAGT
jgi:hypothetical protein